jgi:hypothetical protein
MGFASLAVITIYPQAQIYQIKHDFMPKPTCTTYSKMDSIN